MSEMDEKVEGPQKRPSEHPPPPTWSPEELQEILEAHRQWVESGGKEGERADLTRATLQGADLSEAHLQGANLFRAGGLTASQVKTAMNWELAFYSDDLLKELGLQSDHNEQVKKKLAKLEMEKKATGGK